MIFSGGFKIHEIHPDGCCLKDKFLSIFVKNRTRVCLGNEKCNKSLFLVQVEYIFGAVIQRIECL